MTDTTRQTDSATRIAERRAMVRGFAEQVAQALSGLAPMGSAAVDGAWDIVENLDEIQATNIQSVTGLTLHFHSPLYDAVIQPDERMNISGNLGDLHRFAPRHDPLTIGISVNRVSQAVAKDIARRLLPRLRQVVEAAQTAKAEHAAKADRTGEAFESLQNATTDKDLRDGCLSLHRHNPDDLNLEFSDDLHNLVGYVPGSTISLRGKVEGYDDPPTVDLTLHNLPLNLARQVCALVCGAAVAQRRAMIAAQPTEEVEA